MSETLQAVVLAGGLASRLGARARQLPKYLLPVGGRPLAHWQLERLAACGFTEALVCIGHLGQRIVEALGDGGRFGLELRYLADGPRPLGTGGALRAAAGRLHATFLLTYGDALLPFDYASPLRDLRAHPDALGTMAVLHNRGRFDSSNLQVEGDRVTAYQQRGTDRSACEWIDYGATALRRTAAKMLAPDQTDLGALQAALAAQGRLRAVAARHRFYEIGSPEGLAALDALLSEAPERFTAPGSDP